MKSKAGRPRIGKELRDVKMCARFEPEFLRAWRNYINNKGFSISRGLELALRYVIEHDSLQTYIEEFKKSK